jgi:(R,R)-butanediol dehydrogenase / meso-butanediol dehydrogenase / diacetyl reductase
VHAALVEPFAVGLHGIRGAEIALDEDVLVVGAGGVGLTTIAWARAEGARRVTAADPDPRRRALAEAIGATDTVVAATDAASSAYDAAVECVGHPELLHACRAAVRPRGRIVISGVCHQSMPIEPVTALLKELTIRFSVCYRPDEFREVIAAFDSRRTDPAPMVGPALTLNRIAEAFDLVRDTGVQGRVLLTPNAPPAVAQRRSQPRWCSPRRSRLCRDH